jgi:hypothetical protein
LLSMLNLPFWYCGIYKYHFDTHSGQPHQIKGCPGSATCTTPPCPVYRVFLG